jgi:hypothetical protein
MQKIAMQYAMQSYWMVVEERDRPDENHKEDSQQNSLQLTLCSRYLQMHDHQCSINLEEEEEEHVGDFFTVKKTLGSGLGAYATRLLPRFTLVLVEEPILCGVELINAKSFHQNGTHACQHDDENYLRDVVGLDDSSRRRLWKMHDQYVNTYIHSSTDIDHSRVEEKRLLGIIESNAYCSTDENALGLYPIAGRMNHSCSPNMGYGFDGWTIRMYTTRDIQPGEELTGCYSDVVYHGSREFRQAFLQGKFHFRCQCRAICYSSNLDIVKVSDERRTRLEFLTMLLGSRSGRIREEPTRFDLDIILECINILVIEGIDHNMVAMYQFAYEAAHKLNAIDVIKEHGFDCMCMSLFEVSKGSDHAATKAFRERLIIDAASMRFQ